MAHVHAELMAEYAKDAAITDKPWLLWEYRDSRQLWHTSKVPLAFFEDREYRRKPNTHKVNGVEVPAPLTILKTGQKVFTINSGLLAGVKCETVTFPIHWEPLLQRGCLFATADDAHENFLAIFPLRK